MGLTQSNKVVKLPEINKAHSEIFLNL